MVDVRSHRIQEMGAEFPDRGACWDRCSIRANTTRILIKTAHCSHIDHEREAGSPWVFPTTLAR